MKKKLLALFLFCISILIGIIALKNYTIAIDSYVYNIIIKLRSPFCDNFFKIVSFFFSTYAIIIYCIILLIILKNRKYSYYVIFMMLSEALINNVIKVIFRRPRPNNLALVIENTYSFPSGHTMAACIITYLIGNYIAKQYPTKKYLITSLEIIIILLVGISRIYLGVHYFTDIIGAVLISIDIIIIVNDLEIFEKYINRGNKNDNKIRRNNIK